MGAGFRVCVWEQGLECVWYQRKGALILMEVRNLINSNANILVVD